MIVRAQNVQVLGAFHLNNASALPLDTLRYYTFDSPAELLKPGAGPQQVIALVSGGRLLILV